MQTTSYVTRFEDLDLMQYTQGERDLVMLQHGFIVEWVDGNEDIIASTLERYGSIDGRSAMVTLVDVPCGIAVQFILNGNIDTPGVFDFLCQRDL